MLTFSQPPTHIHTPSKEEQLAIDKAIEEWKLQFRKVKDEMQHVSAEDLHLIVK